MFLHRIVDPRLVRLWGRYREDYIYGLFLVLEQEPVVGLVAAGEVPVAVALPEGSLLFRNQQECFRIR